MLGTSIAVHLHLAGSQRSQLGCYDACLIVRLRFGLVDSILPDSVRRYQWTVLFFGSEPMNNRRWNWSEFGLRFDICRRDAGGPSYLFQRPQVILEAQLPRSKAAGFSTFGQLRKTYSRD